MSIFDFSTFYAWFLEISDPDTIENGHKNITNNDTALILWRTFSLVSTHFLSAGRDEPVRSFMSKIAFTMILRVAILR